MIQIRIGIKIEKSDPDPHQNSADPQQWFTYVPGSKQYLSRCPYMWSFLKEFLILVHDFYLLAVVRALEVGEVEQLTHLPLHLRLAARLEKRSHNIRKESRRISDKVCPFFSVRIRIWDLVSFCPLDPGSRIGFFWIPNPYFESLVTIFWVKSSIILCKLAKKIFLTSSKIYNVQFCDICGYKKNMTTNFFLTPLFCFCFWIRDTRSGMDKIKDSG